MARLLDVPKGPSLAPLAPGESENRFPRLPSAGSRRPPETYGMLGSSAAMAPVFATIERVAAVEVDVLIVGPTGTGKELVAQAIHQGSVRRQGPFVPVNCGAIPEGLMERDFFGHERGAFTGAQSRSAGLLEEARAGTVFLDEVNQLPWTLQAKLLRVLQERTSRRVGGTREVALDVRFVAASSADLAGQVEQGLFRADLYHRLNVVRILLPPLKERSEDIALLAGHFCSRYAKTMRQRPLTISPEAMGRLQHYAWPGNVRQLENLIRGLTVVSSGPVIGIEQLPQEIITGTEVSQAVGGSDFFARKETCVRAFEQDYLRRLLRNHQGNVAAAAQTAGLPRWTLYRLLKQHALRPEDFRPGGPDQDSTPAAAAGFGRLPTTRVGGADA